MAIPSSWGIDTSGFTKPYKEAGTLPGSYATRVNVALRTGYATRTSGVNKATLAALAKAKALYAPGGGFGTGVEAAIERGRVKAEASGMQRLVGAGLAGTTMVGTLGKKYQEEVAMPVRLSIEEERARAISGIEMAEAGMGFQAGEAGLQRGFQAGESSLQRELQTYIANLQASLQRESMAFQPQQTVTGGQARQFPSLYDQGGIGTAPDIGGGMADTPWPTPAPLFKEQEELGLPIGGGF